MSNSDSDGSSNCIGEVIIMETGGLTCRCGRSGADAPEVEVPCVSGTRTDKLLRHSGITFGSEDALRVLVGHEAMSKHSQLKLVFPFRHGIVADWDSMQRVWESTLFGKKEEGGLGLCDYPRAVYLIEAPITPKSTRDRMVHMASRSFCQSDEEASVIVSVVPAALAALVATAAVSDVSEAFSLWIIYIFTMYVDRPFDT